jgi:hypothetical protein
MTRTLVFGTEIEDQRRFILLYNAFTAGGNQTYRQQGGQRPPEVRRSESRVIRALHDVSVIVDEQTGGRKLNPAGGAFTVAQGEFILVEKYLECAPLPTEVSLDHADLLDWVSTASKSED